MLTMFVTVWQFWRTSHQPCEFTVHLYHTSANID